MAPRGESGTVRRPARIVPTPSSPRAQRTRLRACLGGDLAHRPLELVRHLGRDRLDAQQPAGRRPAARAGRAAPPASAPRRSMGRRRPPALADRVAAAARPRRASPRRTAGWPARAPCRRRARRRRRRRTRAGRRPGSAAACSSPSATAAGPSPTSTSTVSCAEQPRHVRLGEHGAVHRPGLRAREQHARRDGACVEDLVGRARARAAGRSAAAPSSLRRAPARAPSLRHRCAVASAPDHVAAAADAEHERAFRPADGFFERPVGRGQATVAAPARTPASRTIASMPAAARSNSSSAITGVPSNGRSRSISTHDMQPSYSGRTRTVTGRWMR